MRNYVIILKITPSVYSCNGTRNPADTIASTFLYEERFLGKISNCDKREWLIKKAKYWRYHVKSWLGKSGVLRLRFEDIINSPMATLEHIAANIDCTALPQNPILPPRIKSHWHGRLLRFSKQSPSTEIVTGVSRISFDELFDKDMKEEFIDIVKDLSNDIGYPL